jgi:hypothetical protein
VDGKTWRTIARHRDNPGVRNVVSDTFPPMEMRYIRIHGDANTANRGFHLLEIEALGQRIS